MQWSQSDSNNTQDIALSVLYPFYGERSRWHHIVVVRNGNYITLYVDDWCYTNITRTKVINKRGAPDGAR